MSQKILVWLLTLVAALLPTYLIRFDIFGIPTTALELLVLLTIALAIIQFAHSRKITNYQLLITNYPLSLSIVLFIAAATISVLIAPDIRAAFGLWRAYIIEPIGLFFVVLAVPKTDRDRRRIVIALTLSAIFVAAIGIWQKFFPDGIFGFWSIYRSPSNQEWYAEATRRVTSVYPFPNAVGLFLAPIAVLLRGILMHSIRRFTDGKRKFDLHQLLVFLGLVTASFFMVLAVFWARSQGALVGIVAGVVVLGLLSEHWRKLTTQIMTVVIVLFFLALPFQQLVVAEFGLRDASIPIRMKQYKETWRCLIQSPKTILSGGGLSGYKTLVGPCHKSKGIEIFQYPHNIFLNFWSEMGLLGLGSFAAIIVLFYQRGIQFIFWARKTRIKEPHLFHPNPIALPMALLGAMTALLVHGLVDVPYFKNDLAILFWLLMALMLTSTKKKTLESTTVPDK